MSRVDVAAAYDSRADEYIQTLGALEQMAPSDRATITSWQRGISGRILDAGCGPGHWSDVLSQDGTREVTGIDASGHFIASARRRFPHVGLVVGDLAALPISARSVSGILSWFSIIHAAPVDVPQIVREFARVLVPGGSLLLGFFDGEAGAPFDHAVTRAYYWSAEALGEVLAPQGFVVEWAATRQDPGVRRQGALAATLMR